jgi:CDP-6-deoxy-D-xylo-4-hexulose-3-dehydrase
MMSIDKKIDELVSLKLQENDYEDFVPGITPVPVSGKVIGREEIKNMIEASLDGWLTTGRFNKEFEKKIAEAVGAKIAITVNSGSSANLVAFMTLTSPKLGERAIKAGDEVITVAAGFPTTVNPIIQFGAVPVFIDIDIPTYNIDVSKIENAITKKTKAIMIAHALGNPFNIKKVREICDKNNLWLVQDTCDALGSKFDNNKVGFYGDIGTLSFYPAHHITMGEGGVVYSNSMKLKRIAESFRDWGRDCYCDTGKDNTCKKRFDWKLGDLPHGYDHKYIYSHCGYNLKITDMQAACGVAQIDKLESFINKRNSNFDYLKKNLSELSDKYILPEATEGSTPSWFGFLITIKDNQIDRNKITRFLNEKKIGTRLMFAGNITKQPYIKNKMFKVSSDLHNTDTVMKNSFWVGVYPGLQKKHLDFIVENIQSYKE